MSAQELERTLPHLHHGRPPLRIETSHLTPLLNQVMYRLIHTYNAIDPILENLKPERGLNIAAYTFFAETWLRQHIKHLHSFDYSLPMVIEHGRPTINSFDNNNVELSCMDVRNLAFPDETFDFASYIELAGTSKSTDYDFVMKSLKQVHRVLKPKGSLVINFKSIMGEEKLKSHKQYQQVAAEVQDGFPNFRGVPISRAHFTNDLKNSFQVVSTLGQGFITENQLPFVYTVENEGIQWDPYAIVAKPLEEIDFDTEHPLYWTLQLQKL